MNGKNGTYRVGFDLGGTKMMAAVYDAGWKVVGRCRRRTKGQLGTVAGLARVAETIHRALQEAGIEVNQVVSIGVGAPGPVDVEAGIVPETPNLPWRDANIRKALTAEFKIPVHVCNDVDAGVFGEYRFGSAVGARCALGVFPGTGIGGGCVYEGRIFRGRAFSCMEIGHMQVVPDGPLCGCGQRGCLEGVSSRMAIAAAASLAAFRGDAPHLLELAGGLDLMDIRSGALARSIEAGDHVIEVIVRDAARWLGIGIANVINLLLPDVVVLGGGLVEEMPGLYAAEVEESARAKVMSAFRKEFKLRVAKLGDDACVLGAGAWAYEAVTRGAGGKGNP